MTNLDKNIQDIDKWLDIYKKLKIIKIVSKNLINIL